MPGPFANRHEPAPGRRAGRPPVSAIVPCFNAAPWLRQCLDSVFGQSHPPAEVIVVDDGSTDDSAALAAAYPVRLLRLEANRGSAAARNAGIRAAAHDLIAWLDADDFWDTDHLATVTPLIERCSDAAVAFGRVRFVDRSNRIPWGLAAPCPGPVDLLSESARRCVVPIMAAVTRRTACLDVGGFRESLRAAVDFDLWLRLAVRWPFVWTPQVTANYRWRLAPSQVSADVARQHRSIWQSRMLVRAELQASPASPRASAMDAPMREQWRTELAGAWQQRDLATVRLLLGLPGVPGEEGPFAARLQRFLGLAGPAAPTRASSFAREA